MGGEDGIAASYSGGIFEKTSNESHGSSAHIAVSPPGPRRGKSIPVMAQAEGLPWDVMTHLIRAEFGVPLHPSPEPPFGGGSGDGTNGRGSMRRGTPF